MKPIEKFVKKMAKAKERWEASGADYSSWLSYMDQKDGATCALLDAIPEASAIGRLNQMMIDLPPNRWAHFMRVRIEAVKKGIPCEDCGTKIPYPARRCDQCAAEHVQQNKERREVAQLLKRRHRKAKR